jgi:hypothetical protein
MSLVCSVVLGLWPSISGAEEDRNSGNFWQPRCKAVIEQDSSEFVGGACLGIALMLKSYGRLLENPYKVCIPEDATMTQILRVITTWVDQHPSKMHQPFTVLA